MSGMCYYPLAATRQRELYIVLCTTGKGRKAEGGEERGNLSCRNESLASSFAFVAFPPTHTCEREGGFVAFLLSFVESRRLNLPPRCQKKIGRGGIMASRQSCQSVEAAGEFSPLSLFLVAPNFCKNYYCLPTDDGGGGGVISIQSPFFWLFLSVEEQRGKSARLSVLFFLLLLRCLS